ncbi:MFS transporter [Alteribacter keqinensis]|uniref:MFS transporter n=1 Tax=Alteribacter keqinensis TaxID=2483800 RepID=A0A3M7TMI5_9BACI|nr:MFS transporter [Alteribacter keqinensis]RNA66672.1 MFS transporter [Alteribacter keqinensis]
MSLFRFHRTIKIRLALQFLTTMATMSVVPYLIIYFSATLGTVTTGFMFLGVITATVAGSLTGGLLADKAGRKQVILWTEGVAVFGFIAVAFVNSPWLVLPFAAFLLFVMIQFSTGAGEPAYQALLIDVSKPENRRSVYTYAYWLRNLGMAVGGIAGAFLFMDHHFYLFLGVAFCLFISFIVTAFFITDTYVPLRSGQRRVNTSKAEASFKTGYRKVLLHRVFMAFICAHLLIVSVEEQLTTVTAVRLVDALKEPRPLLPFLTVQVDGLNIVGLLKAENTILVICLTVLVSAFIRKLNDRWVLMTGLALFFTGYTIISFSEVPIVLLAAMFIASAGEVLHIPVKQALLAGFIPDHARSTYMGIYYLFTYLGVSTAGAFIILSAWVPTWLFTFVFAAMGAVSLITFNRLTQEPVHEAGRAAATM